MTTTFIYTDGSSLNNANKNKRRAGCAYLVLQDNKYVYLSGRYLGEETNNFAELSAIYSAFCWMYHHQDEFYKNLTFFIDSKYAINIVNKTNTPKVNKELIDKIFAKEKIFIDNGFKITYKHVAAHTGKKDIHSKANDMVDKTAKKCAEIGEDIKIKNFDKYYKH